jgi:hypothetical protein
VSRQPSQYVEFEEIFVLVLAVSQGNNWVLFIEKNKLKFLFTVPLKKSYIERGTLRRRSEGLWQKEVWR